MKGLIQSRYFPYLVFGIFAIILFIWFFNSDLSSPGQDITNNGSDIYSPKKREVQYREPTLIFFNQTVEARLDQDRLNFHYPYIQLVKTAEEKTRLFNVETATEEDAFPGILLDYYDTHTLEDQSGTTLLDGKELQCRCFYGFIKNENEILCTLYGDEGTLWLINNKEITKTKIANAPEGVLITDFYYDQNKDDIYLGLMDTNNQNTSSIQVLKTSQSDSGEVSAETRVIQNLPNQVDIFYVFSDRNERSYMYYGAFNSKLNNNTEGYYQIHNDNVEIKSEEYIIFYVK
ncbi:hypothetical protein JW887_04850 [Candidatus Dojkabacteria bacterium]|nr:hypothetical protein [Candidatus Dojkabacteria bacterium]